MSSSRAPARRPATRPASWPEIPVPVLRPDEIVVTRDDGGRLVVVLPDPVASALAFASRQVINPGAIDERPRSYPAGSPVASTMRRIFAVVASSPVASERVDPSGPTDSEQAWDGACFGFLVGTSAWDHNARWWTFNVDSLEHRALTCMGSVHIAARSGAVTWSG